MPSLCRVADCCMTSGDLTVDDFNWRIRVIGHHHSLASLNALRTAAGEHNVREHFGFVIAYVEDGATAIQTVEDLERDESIDARVEHWDTERVAWLELGRDEAANLSASLVASTSVSGMRRQEKQYVPVSEQLRDSGLLQVDGRSRRSSAIRTSIEPGSGPTDLAPAARQAIARAALYLAGIACLAAGVLVPAPNPVRAIFGISGVGLLLAHAVRIAKSPPNQTLLGNLFGRVPREPARRAAIVLGVILGLAGSGYACAMITGHALKGAEGTAQLDQSSTYPNADTAELGAVAACALGFLFLYSAPHWKSKQRMTAGIVAVFLLGGAAFAAGRHLFRS
jgi:hypothetical protein